jgi:hypothetical protein
VRAASPLRRAGAAAGDRHWAGHARCAVCCGAAFSATTALIDRCTSGLTPARAVLWLLLGLVAGAVMLPPRVTAGDGWLAVRGVLRERRVRTGALVSVRLSGTVAFQILLRDADGRRVEVEPRVLLANPVLWHALDRGIRASRAGGTLPPGPDHLAPLRERIDTDAAHEIFRASGLR